MNLSSCMAHTLHDAASAECVQLDEPQLQRPISGTEDMATCPVKVIEDEHAAHTDRWCPPLDVGNYLGSVISIVVEEVDRGGYRCLAGPLSPHCTVLGGNAVPSKTREKHLERAQMPSFPHGSPPLPVDLRLLSRNRHLGGPSVDRQESSGAHRLQGKRYRNRRAAHPDTQLYDNARAQGHDERSQGICLLRAAPAHNRGHGLLNFR